MGEGAREVSGERACFDTVSLSAAEHIACNVRASGRAEEEDGRVLAVQSRSDHRRPRNGAREKDCALR